MLNEGTRLFLVSDDAVINPEPDHVSNNSDEINSHSHTNESVNKFSAHELESLHNALQETCLKNK